MKNKLPPCFAFKNTGKHPRKDEIKKRFNELDKSFKWEFSCIEWEFSCIEFWYGRKQTGFYITHSLLQDFGSTVVEITEDEFLAMTEPELTELPKVFAFKNDPDSPNHELLKERFNSLDDNKGNHVNLVLNYYYGILEDGTINSDVTLWSFGKGVVEITEQQFLDLTEPKPELTKLPDNFYFQYVDEKDREVLKERFDKLTKVNLSFNGLDCYYGVVGKGCVVQYNKDSFPNSTEITQQDFIRLTEPKQSLAKIKYILKARHSDNQTDIIISSMGFKYPKDGTIVSYENLNGLYNSIIQLNTSIPGLTTSFSTVNIGCLHDVYLQDIKELLSVYKSNFMK